MAKSKRAAALFEVIHASQQLSREKPKPTPARYGLRSWFNRSPSKNDPTQAPIERAAPVISSAPAPSTPEEPRLNSPSNDTGGVDVKLDPERQLITFKFSYTSAIIVGFAALVTFGLAYLVGKKMSRSPVLAIATQTSEQLRAKPAHPEVLNVVPKSNTVSSAIPAAPVTEGDNGTSSRAAEPAGEKIDPAVANNQRSVNLNYVVIQSYPDEKSADDARDALLKAGVGCTVEQKLRGLNPAWFTVVGTQGFARISSDEYKTYITKLEQISQQFAQNKRSFRAFQPMAYKWDRAANSTASVDNQ